MPLRQTIRVFWILVGGVSLVLGLIGVLLPVLPTTPFVILAAFAFGKGSVRMQRWLEGTALFGPAIHSWKTTGAIAPNHKLLATGMMAGSFILAIVLALPMKVLIIQAVCMAAAGAFVLSRPNH
jgi:uncharacterized membrane protein YbaN (DUF454 family)